jgi:hypothetical protein
MKERYRTRCKNPMCGKRVTLYISSKFFSRGGWKKICVCPKCLSWEYFKETKQK